MHGVFQRVRQSHEGDEIFEKLADELEADGEGLAASIVLGEQWGGQVPLTNVRVEPHALTVVPASSGVTAAR